MKIGSEVGLALDHDHRGVIVDSRPESGWLVFWCHERVDGWEWAVNWCRPADLWERPAEPLHPRVARLLEVLEDLDEGAHLAVDFSIDFDSLRTP